MVGEEKNKFLRHGTNLQEDLYRQNLHLFMSVPSSEHAAPQHQGVADRVLTNLAGCRGLRRPQTASLPLVLPQKTWPLLMLC